jgi:4-hydroxy-3-polyprenylbenzoate decarboxylase
LALPSPTRTTWPCSGLATAGGFTQAQIADLANLSRWAFLLTFAGVGLRTNVRELMKQGWRPLVVVPRETPMSLPQLRNMVAAAEAGAMILPAMPAFYQQPKTIDDLADFIAGKILSALEFDHQLFTPWKGEA